VADSTDPNDFDASGAAKALPIANWKTAAEINPVWMIRVAVAANCFAFILPPGQGIRASPSGA